MTNHQSDDREADLTQAKPAEPQGFNPRETEHPAGTEQAAENEANDPPG